jgi:hypothetical protein
VKQIVILEGANDSLFVETVIKKEKTTGCVYKKFNFEEERKRNSEKAIETNVISSFLSPSSPYHILLKEEHGKGRLFKLFPGILLQITHANSNLIFMFDADSKDIDMQLNKLFGKIYQRNKSLKIEKKDERVIKTGLRKRCYVITKAFGNKYKQLIGNFTALIFDESLEKLIKKNFVNIDPKDSIIKFAETISFSDLYFDC